MSQVIPKSWAKATLDDIGLIQTGNTPSKKNPEYYGGLFPIFKPTDLNSTQVITKAGEYLSDEGKSVARRISANSTYVTCIGATIGKTGFVAVEGTCNQQINTISPYEGIDPKWVYYWLISPNMNYEIISNSSSTTLPIINKSRFSNLATVLPPLAEQKIIADKLDELLAQVESTKARLDAIPAILKSFRQSLLAAAVSGKLTEEWRGSNKYEIQGNKLLPVGWKSEPASMVCLKVQSGSTPRDNPFDQNGTIPFLKVYNIVNQKIDFDYKPQFVTADVHKSSLKRSIAQPNDVLMNIVGPPLGKVAVLTDQYPEWNLNQAITLFRADPSALHHLFLYHFLCEGELVREVMPDTKGSVGQVNISLSQCRDALLPIPPLDEQTEIVRRVEALFAFADKVEAQVSAAQARVNNLTQSILAKAFRGELTADWRAANPELISGDNSADALLKRIKAERKKLQSATKPKAKKEKAW